MRGLLGLLSFATVAPPGRSALRGQNALVRMAGRRRIAVPPSASVTSPSWVTAGDAEDLPPTKLATTDFLIGNKHNEVLRLQCPTKPVLQQGILETATLPHICIAGESNAGKSSLLNHLLVKRNMARASSVAGKTRTVDMMLVNQRIVVTDLPGLPSRDGQVTGMWESTWRPLVFDYFNQCDQLLGMLYVHDVRWKVSSAVREFITDVRATGLPVMLILTKDDRLLTELPTNGREPPSRDAVHALRERLMRRVRRSLAFDGVHVHYSTDNALPVSRKARRRLLRYIESMVQAGSREDCRNLLDEIAEKKFREFD